MKFASILVSFLSLASVSAKSGTRGAKKEASVQLTPRFLSGKGKGKSSSSSSNSDDDPCSLCNGGRPDSITFRYNVPAVDSPYHEGSSDDVCGASTAYPATNTVSIGGSAPMAISVGDEITINNPETWTQFDFGAGPNCEIHTSCSKPLIGDDQIGPWVVVPPPTCGDTGVPEECLICDSTDGNKIKPPSLTFEYIAAGQNSAYQPEDKATCREAMYPENTLIKAFDKKGNEIYSGTHSSGDIFTITPSDSGTEFSAETTFTFSGMSDSCFIHTSCSVPLVQDDQIGPLKVLAGNDCLPKEKECVVANKDVYECGEDIAITFDFGATSEPTLVGDWVGIYPCETTEYKHAESWLYTCVDIEVGGLPNGSDKATPCMSPETATVTFTDPMPDYNDAGPHVFPIAPYYSDGVGSEVRDCFKAVLLRLEGPSTPPYVEVCTSEPFTINAGTSADCQIREERSFAAPAP